MSTLYLGADLDTLAGKLAAVHAATESDFFVPVTVAVLNPMARWLRLWLARKQGVVINFQFNRLETVMWELMREVDQRQHEAPVELLNGNSYRLMILSLLLDREAGGADVAPLREHLPRDGSEARRDGYRRAWQLAGRLGDLIREYEFHRQQVLIQKWLRGQDGYPNDPIGELRIERSQRALFQMITREPDGLRALLSRKSKKLQKTLPQYAHEVMELPQSDLAPRSERIIHVFGVTQISAMHIDVLRWLGERYDLRLYYLNPLVSHLPKARSNHDTGMRTAMQDLANRIRQPEDSSGRDQPADDPLLTTWGRAGAESLWSMGNLLGGERPFAVESITSAPKDQPSSVLGRLQNRLRGGEGTNKKKLPQDRTVQIIACPGAHREVQTVYQSILHNLKGDATLKQTDIAILVTDMARYRPVIQSVFDGRPDLLHYNLADVSAAGLSAYGHGVLGLFDLALESFTRSRVFAVLFNPCFLARLGVEREQALTWLEWAEELGIYNCWDAKDKHERGYAGTPLYSWQLGLRRLRLGRLMDSGDERADVPVPAFQDIVPFANLASGDKEQLDDFCRAVEGLLPSLHRLRGLRLSGSAWSNELRQLIDAFLDVPEDRPGETEVRDALFHALAELRILDLLDESPEREPELPLALLREFVADNLEGLEGRRGDLLTGGVSIAALRPLRPIPFRIIYIVGLGEGMFPGSDARSTFDLHSRERRPGDIRPTEANRFLLLEEILAAREKIYLSYNCRDIQRDQVLHPCGPLNQLRRYLAEQIVGGAFKTVNVPLCGNDAQCLEPKQADYMDVLVNYDEMERLQAILGARRNGGLKLNAKLAAQVERRLELALPSFVLPVNSDTAAPKPPTVRLWELNGFLRSPAEAALKRHLRLLDEDEPEAVDEEPFYTTSPRDYQLIRVALHDFVTQALNTTVPQSLQSWPERFTRLYEQWRLRGRVPDGAFAEVDRTRFEQLLSAHISGAGGLAEFLEARRRDECCGPLLLGESVIPVGARRRFPALKLALPNEVRIVGTFPLAWRSADAFEMLVLSNVASGISDKELCKPLLEPFLFYLALKAGTEALDGVSSAQWLGDRKLSIHVAHRTGITEFDYMAEDISQPDACAYLAALAGDFLNPAGFETLPFDLIIKEKALKLAYTLADSAPEMDESRARYDTRLADSIEEDQEKADYAAHRSAELVQVIDLLPPQDAFDKVRQRFRLIDRGPARLREGDSK